MEEKNKAIIQLKNELRKQVKSELKDELRDVVKQTRYAEIADRVRLGETYSSIGKDLGLSKERIRQLYNEVKDDSMALYDKRVWKTLKKLVKAYNMSYKDISNKCGISDQTVVQVLNGNETYIRPGRSYSLKGQHARAKLLKLVLKDLEKRSEQIEVNTKILCNYLAIDLQNENQFRKN